MFADPEPTALIWILMCTVLVMMMQVGFCCLESGLVLGKNSANAPRDPFAKTVAVAGLDGAGE